MIHFERTREINAAPEAVWAVLERYMHIDEFAPQITSVDALTEGENGVGSKRRNHFENGGSMVEEVTEWTPNRGYHLEMSEMDGMPLHEGYSELAVEPAADGRSNMTWGMDYRVKYGPIGWVLGQTIMKRMMSGVLDANLEGLANQAEAN